VLSCLAAGRRVNCAGRPRGGKRKERSARADGGHGAKESPLCAREPADNKLFFADVVDRWRSCFRPASQTAKTTGQEPPRRALALVKAVTYDHPWPDLLRVRQAGIGQ